MSHFFHHDDTLTTEDQRRLEAIAAEMSQQGLPSEFVSRALSAASSPEPGIIEMLFDWQTATEGEARDEIVADIQSMLFMSLTDPVAHALFADPDRVSASVVKLKQRLRPIVEQQGGIEAVSAKSGIPTAWFKRFFNSAAVPPQAALKKLRVALGLVRAEVALDLPEK